MLDFPDKQDGTGESYSEVGMMVVLGCFAADISAFQYRAAILLCGLNKPCQVSFNVVEYYCW
jgi:hypothetical protein